MDAILSAVIALLILAGSFNVLRESVHILLEGAPRHINIKELEADITSREGVDEVHDLHLWSVCSHIVTLACHVHIADSHLDRRDKIVAGLHTWLREKYRINHSIIEVETGDCSQELIAQDLKHGHVCHEHEH
jgi:cobalt-zinc-cadmium efflux system protein